MVRFRTEVIRLRLPDTGLTGCQDEVASRLADLIAGFDVCLAPWVGDVHADHEAAGRAARQAAAIACFTSQLESRGGGLAPVLPARTVAHLTRGMEVLCQ